MARNKKWNERRMNVILLLAGLLLGGLTGASAALLWAPQSGARMRRQLHDSALELSEQAERIVEEMQR